MDCRILLESNLSLDKYKGESSLIIDEINGSNNKPEGEVMLVTNNYGSYVVNEEQMKKLFKNKGFLMITLYECENRDFTFQKLKDKYKFIHVQIIENGASYISRCGAPHIQLYIKSDSHDRLMDLAIRKWIKTNKVYKKHDEERLNCADGEYAILLKS